MPDFTWDHDAPLARAKGESSAANEALGDYARMGSRRSLRKLLARYQDPDIYPDTAPDDKIPPTTYWNTLEGWSRKNDWQARVARFDELDKEDKERQWEERRDRMLEQDWEQGQALRDKVAQFLEQLPRFVTTSEQETTRRRADGTTEIVRVITVELNASLAQIASALKTGSELQRLATNEPTDDIRLSGAALDALIARELAELNNLREAGHAQAHSGSESGDPPTD